MDQNYMLRKIWILKTDLGNDPEPDKVLKILLKLRDLKVTKHILKDTEIKVDVKNLSRCQGYIGYKAREVLKVWRASVRRGGGHSSSSDKENRRSIMQSSHAKIRHLDSSDGDDIQIREITSYQSVGTDLSSTTSGDETKMCPQLSSIAQKRTLQFSELDICNSMNDGVQTSSAIESLTSDDPTTAHQAKKRCLKPTRDNIFLTASNWLHGQC